MANKLMSLELSQRAMNLVTKHGTVTKAARAAGIARKTLGDQYASAVQVGLKPTTDNTDELTALRLKAQRLEGELRRAQEVSAGAEQVLRAIGNIDRQLAETAPPTWTQQISKPSAPGVPTLFLSDLHWGEVVYPAQIGGVNQFNVTIAKRRLKYTFDTAVSLLKILDSKLDYPGIVIPLGGDMISGNIHDELVATNELGSIPAMLDLHGDITALLKSAANTFGHVFVPCVSGNHGRDTRKIWSKDRHHTSFDWLLYQFLAKTFADDKRVQFLIPDGPDASYRVYDYRYLLTHGDQFRGGDGIIGPLGPLIRGDQRKRTRNSQIDQDYDTMICGHWHQYITLRRLIVNGSLKGYDEYAYSSNFPFEIPTQALWLTHPVHGITFRAPVYCEKQKEPLSKAWVSFREDK